MRSHSLIALAGAVLLSACATYSDKLEDKLAGKSPAEKRVILAQECRKEIEAGIKPDSDANVRHFDRFRTICEEMTGQKISVQPPR
jgi:hypothetical protein